MNSFELGKERSTRDEIVRNVEARASSPRANVENASTRANCTHVSAVVIVTVDAHAVIGPVGR